MSVRIKVQKVNLLDWLFMGTILFFGLSMIHVTFALFGILCAVTPFMMYAKTGKKLWCTTYCPRASLFSSLLRKVSLGMKTPDWLFTEKTKRSVIVFFCINLFFATMSTVMVALGRLEPMAFIRFLMAFQLPVELPQLINFAVPDYLLHLSYRVFSIMFSSTVVGLVLGILYKPRTWCGICPIQTLTTIK